MPRPKFHGFTVFAVAFGLLLPVTAGAAWKEQAGTLGREEDRFAVRAGWSYGTMNGSEIEKTDPSTGFEVGATYRVLGSLSLAGSYATDAADVDGQLVALMDQRVRPDGRSATVLGKVETTRFRVGVRLDAYREQDWRVWPYFAGAVVFSTIDITIDSVNGAPPVPFPPDPAGNIVDISSYSDSQIGAMVRTGLEYPVASAVSVDVNGSFEIIEFEPGTNSIFAVNTGLLFRF
ncbi:MAG: outer membrane beta-barrel protein [Gemmatimonadetes bacterium]|nr:outer membrane beta-barrel protein [Gemmatimonadota bacterium]